MTIYRDKPNATLKNSELIKSKVKIARSTPNNDNTKDVN